MPLRQSGQDKTPKRPKRRACGWGNNLPEYALVGAGILIVSIGTLELPGGRLDQLFAYTENMIQHESQIAFTTATSQQQAPKNSFSTLQASQASGGQSQTGNPTGYSSGETPQVDSPKYSITQTAGSNGSTDSKAHSSPEQDPGKKSIAQPGISMHLEFNPGEPVIGTQASNYPATP